MKVSVGWLSVSAADLAPGSEELGLDFVQRPSFLFERSSCFRLSDRLLYSIQFSVVALSQLPRLFESAAAQGKYEHLNLLSASLMIYSYFGHFAWSDTRELTLNFVTQQVLEILQVSKRKSIEA